MDHRSFIKARRTSRGASLIEVLVGLFVIIPLFLMIIDLSAIVLGQITNDALVKRCARAAAQQATSGAANTAANAVIGAYQSNGIVSAPVLANFSFDAGGSGVVQVETQVTITIPAEVPFVPMLSRSRPMRARATEPIVMLPANP
jgi:Flp pilus assembly protein TadG